MIRLLLAAGFLAVLLGCQPKMEGGCQCGATRFDRTLCNYNPAVVTEGLKIEVDANKANGVGFPGPGCSSLTWTNLANSSNSGILSGFNTCSASAGWVGSGTAKDPYRLEFSGTQYVVFPAVPQTGAGSFTIDVWFRTTAAFGAGGYRDLFTMGIWTSTNHGIHLMLNQSNNHLALDLTDTAGPTTSASLNDGAWHSGAVVNTSGSFQLFVDGRATGSAVSATPNILNVEARIGAPLNGDVTTLFIGSIFRVAAYNRALTAAEMSQNYNAIKPYFDQSACK